MHTCTEMVTRVHLHIHVITRERAHVHVCAQIHLCSCIFVWLSLYMLAFDTTCEIVCPGTWMYTCRCTNMSSLAYVCHEHALRERVMMHCARA